MKKPDEPDPARDQSLFEVISRGIANINDKRMWERENRIALLWVHVEVGLLAGILMLTFGTAPVFEGWFGADARFITGIPAIVGGLVLAAGLAQRPRRIGWEIAGLGMMALWDLGMSTGLGVALSHSPAVGHSIPYPIIIYGGYFQLLCVHLWTLASRTRETS